MDDIMGLFWGGVLGIFWGGFQGLFWIMISEGFWILDGFVNLFGRLGGVSILDGFVNQDGRYARATRKTVTIINQKRCPFINISLHMSSWAGRTESDSCCSPHIQRQQMCIVRSGVESRNCPSCITQLNIHPPTQFAGPTAQRRV